MKAKKSLIKKVLKELCDDEVDLVEKKDKVFACFELIKIA